MFKVIFLLLFVASCQSQTQKELLQKNLDEYYDRYGNRIVSLIEWLDSNINTNSSYRCLYRLKANELHFNYIDSNLYGLGFFYPKIQVSKEHLELLESSTISSIIKIQTKNFFQIELAKFANSGFDVVIIAAHQRKNIDFPLINKYEDIRTKNIENEEPTNLFYKKSENFYFLMTKY